MKTRILHIGHKGTRARGHKGTRARGHKDFFSFLLSPFSFLLSLCLIVGCAQQSGVLSGGEKDTKPPEVLKSVPPNFSTHFAANKITMTFDEYFDLKNINQKLVVSPPMDKKPEFKVKGKNLEITLKDSLQPNRTYALNMGDALVDLNENNPIKNFQYVFSTGDEIDSLQISGKVTLVPDGKLADDVLVMLYNGSDGSAGAVDSLPLKEIPLYISRTDKEGRFTLKNIAAGGYRIFALKDANNNMLFDQPTEPVAYMDSLISPGIIDLKVADSVPPALKDSAGLGPVDSTRLAPADSVKVIPKDSVAVKASDSTKLAGGRSKTAAAARPTFRFTPDSLQLRMFTEARPNQYLSGTERPRKEQVRIRMNEKVDSIRLEFMDLPGDSMPVKLDWYGEPDTLDIWITDQQVAARDSLVGFITFTAYDSLERPYLKTDTVKYRYRPAVKTDTGKKNEFAVSASPERNKSLDPGQKLTLTLSLPYSVADTSKIFLTTGKDSTAQRIEYRLVTDTLKGLMLNGAAIVQNHPRILTIEAPLLADSSYRLKMQAGAFTGLSGQKTDSLDIRFKIKKPDEFGSVKIDIPGLEGSAILELLMGTKVVRTQLLSGPGTVVFPMLAPGKYSARLILDTNSNGKWDSGRYLKHIQPEQVLVFSKELNVKANWEVSETWERKGPEK
ncbi:MAG: Ig-like domain-containing domain [Bacteroidota bacterium]